VEIRGKFQIDKKEYELFIITHLCILKKMALFEKEGKSEVLKIIPIEYSTSTHKEKIGYWLDELKRYLCKKRREKRCKARCGNA